MNWIGKKVLVTGAGGFIGSHLAERLIELGARVRVFVRYNSRNNWGWIEDLPANIQKELEVITGDLRDPNAVRDAVRDIEFVFHLGALIAIPYSYNNPYDVFQVNVFGSLNVFNASKEFGIEKVIHTSTSEVYGTAQYVPIDEKHPLQAQSPYAASKIGADKLAESFYLSYNLPVATVRPFNTYGPRQSARAIIPTIITQALNQRNISLGSLHPTRDLNYVADTVEGFIKVAESSKSVGEVINIGSGKEVSMGDLANKILSLMNKNIEINSDKSRIRPEKSEVDRLLADNSKAKALLQWEPRVSIDEGLKRTIEWISEHISVYKAGIYNV